MYSGDFLLTYPENYLHQHIWSGVTVVFRYNSIMHKTRIQPRTITRLLFKEEDAQECLWCRAILKHTENFHYFESNSNLMYAPPTSTNCYNVKLEVITEFVQWLTWVYISLERGAFFVRMFTPIANQKILSELYSFFDVQTIELHPTLNWP